MRTALSALVAVLVAATAYADPLKCSVTDYKPSPGLTASVVGDTLLVTWDGDRESELRLRFEIDRGTPTIRDLAIRRKGGQWSTVAAHLTPEFRVVSGVRRMTEQQLQPLRNLKIPITKGILERDKWNAFWDAPLYIEGSGVRPPTHSTAIPPMEGILDQPRLPRKPEEIKRATARYHAQGCEVKTNGGRLDVSFPGVELGVFAGRLEYNVYRGTNLIRQAVVARTDEPSVAYKYDAGISGLAIQSTTRVVWRDLAGKWQDYQLGGAKNPAPVGVKASNRLALADVSGGSIAAFPPPHSFHWARETEQNIGYNYYRKDSDASFAFGIRQAEKEEDPEFFHNYAMYSARPGTWQRMPVFLYVSAEPAQAAAEAALTFTRGDHFKPLPGYQVMGTHYHTAMTRRLRESGTLPDLDAVKAAGINIYAPIDGSRDGGSNRLQGLADYYEMARQLSDKNFLVMPNEEMTTGHPDLGGHNDLLISKPVFWTTTRTEGQPFVEESSTYGKVYHVGSQADMMEMAKRENLIIYMPHPRSKGSTGYPDAIKNTPHFLNENYRGVGYRWGMGIDGSEIRLCDDRCLTLLDDMNNWVADVPTPPKYLQAIAETRSDIGFRGKVAGDDTYGMSPVNYVKLDRVPKVDDMSSVINAMKRGDYFVTSGEVLIPSYSVDGTGNQRTVTAEVEWTFPLDFVEVVWGDGQKTDRQIISTTDLPPFGKKRFQIPFNAAGKKWVRFAAWDAAGNGAFVQPIKLESRAPTTAAR
ncbi:MAG: hypothetical protein HYZ58_11485 [Acidobacteria bacterium]|nr:hypothetical protein [Acidobacteriota bacterium]